MDEINPKRKILERLFPDLKTSEDGTPTYKGVPFMTSKGPVVSTLPNGSVA
jgi:aminoacyl tRNA synthase complex-interacting multifunctional protein 1